MQRQMQYPIMQYIMYHISIYFFISIIYVQYPTERKALELEGTIWRGTEMAARAAHPDAVPGKPREQSLPAQCLYKKRKHPQVVFF